MQAQTHYCRNAFSRRILLAILVCGLSTGSTWGAAPIPQVMEYNVHHKGLHVGTLKITINQQDQEYQVQAISDLGSLAKIFLDDFTVESRYRWEKDRAVLLSGQMTDSETGKVRRHFEVDHSTGDIRFYEADHVHSVRFDRNDNLDALSFPLGLIFSGVSLQEKVLYVNPKRTYRTIVTEVSRESITVPAGTFETLKINHTAADGSDRVFRLWIRQGDYPVAIRILSGRTKNLTTWELLP